MKEFLVVLKGVFILCAVFVFSVGIVLFGPVWLAILMRSAWPLLGLAVTFPLFVAMYIYFDRRW